MQIIHHITIDMARHLPVVPVDAVQGDGNTRLLKLSLLENGGAWAAPEGVTAAVAFRKSDGTKGLYDTLPDGTNAISIDGNTVSAILAPQVLTCAGQVSAAVVFHDRNMNQLATFPFTIRVAGNPAAGQEISNDYYRYNLMEAITEAVESALTGVREIAVDSAPAIICEAAGENIAVSDAARRPLQGLSIYGKTTQNGTPTPENPLEFANVGRTDDASPTINNANALVADKEGWQASANAAVALHNNTVVISGPGDADGNSVISYRGKKFKNTVLSFNYKQENTGSSWGGFGIQLNPSVMPWKTKCVLICLKEDKVELQYWASEYSGIIEKAGSYLKDGREQNIIFGMYDLVTEVNAVRIVLSIDGEEIFNEVVADKILSEFEGYLTIVGGSGLTVSLIDHVLMSEDFSALNNWGNGAGITATSYSYDINSDKQLEIKLAAGHLGDVNVQSNKNFDGTKKTCIGFDLKIDASSVTGANGAFEAGIELKNGVNWTAVVGFTKGLLKTQWAEKWNVPVNNQVHRVNIVTDPETSTIDVYLDGKLAVASAKYLQNQTSWNTLAFYAKNNYDKQPLKACFDNLTVTLGGFSNGLRTIDGMHVWVTDGTEDHVQTITVSTPNGLPGIPVSSGGNYTDESGQQWICDEKNLGLGVYVKRLTILHPTKVISSYKGTHDHLCFTVANGAMDTDPTIKGAVLCSHAVTETGNVQYALAKNSVSIVEDRVVLCIDGITTVAEANAFLSNNDVTVMFQSKTPTETALPDQERVAFTTLHTHQMSTAVFNSAGAGMKLSYVADTKTYIDQKLDAIRVAMLNN